MKVLFLDIDGVLNSEDYAKRYHKEHLQELGQHIFVDPAAVELVRDLCETENVKLIISSSWRGFDLESTLKDLESYRDLRPILKYVVGVTPRSVEGVRGEEIETTLRSWSGETIEKYCIVDDDCDILHSQLGYFIQTDWVTGITKEEIDYIKEILK